ncbi:hypothetical protein KE423_003902 [Salmonella enterica]|nr:hypothetical protein [Salmonella enterica]
MNIQSLIKGQASFLFQNAGDSVFGIEGTGLAVLNVDVVDSESHEWKNEITNFPVEGSADIADNIKPSPDELSITCFVSNTPIHGLIDEVANFADRFLNGKKRTQEAFNQLRDLRRQKLPVTVTTRYRVYTNMGISAVTTRRTPGEGDALIFEIRFKEINIVKTRSVKTPEGLGAAGSQTDNATKQRAGATVDAGKSTGKVTKPAAADVQKPVRKSLLAAGGSFF